MSQDHEQSQSTTTGITSVAERPSVAAEANLLRLPLFALHTKGLKNLDGFECRGTTTRGEQTWEFAFRTARSTATLYPGPLSRSVHLAFLSLISEHGLPFANPVTWTWRDLCARLHVQPSGRTVQHLKEAVEATAGLTIYSREALYSKPASQHVNTRKATHLYETVVFVNETLPDGSTADTNYLWLSKWYLDNLNALFTAPLDHELWRYLDRRSPIASRLYEFLLINFYSGVPQLRINYPRLAQFLPVRPERYLSDARKQLEPPFQLLAETRVTGDIAWQRRKNDVAQLRFQRGDRLLGPRETKLARLEPVVAEANASFTVREVRRTPERELVSEFYRLWTNHPDQRPTHADLALAKRLLAQHGRAKSKTILPLAIERLKQHWPGARTFVAVEQYFDDAIQQQQRQQQLAEQRSRRYQSEQAELQQFEQQADQRRQFETHWFPIWQQLAVGEQEAIRSTVLIAHPFLRHAPHEMQFRCLQELARQLAKDRDAASQQGTGDCEQPAMQRL